MTDSLTSVIAISGSPYDEHTRCATFGIYVLKTRESQPCGRHRGLICSRSGERAVLRAIVRLLTVSPAGVRHVIVSKEKLIADTLSPPSPLFGWHRNGLPKRTDTSGPEYTVIKALLDEELFQFVYLRDVAGRAFQQRHGHAGREAEQVKLLANTQGLTLNEGQELWDDEL